MKKLFLFLLIFLFSLAGFTDTPVKASDSNNFSVNAKAAIAVDAASGKILYSQNANQSDMGIASITKLITVYIVYQQIKEGKLHWNTKVPISQYAYDITQDGTASNIQLTDGASYTVKDLVNAALVPSANSAAIALAEKISGTEPKFVNKMRAQLKSWGITDATIVNASGLNNGDLQGHIYPGSAETAENTMSAKDVAIIAMHIIQDFPQILNITKQTSLVFDKDGADQTTMSTTNYMLPGYQTSRLGVDGLKTGNTAYAGECFVGTTVQNGFRIITVILDASANNDDELSRFSATNILMNRIYSTWQAYGEASKHKSLKGHKTTQIINAKEISTPLITKRDFYVVIPIGSKPNLSLRSVKSQKQLQAPISKSTVIATVKATLHDKLGYLPKYSGTVAELIPAHNVERANPFVVFWNTFVNFVNKDL